MSWYIYFFQIPALPEYLIRRNHYAGLPDIFKDVPKEHMTPQDLERYIAAYEEPGALTAMINWYRAMPGSMLNMKKNLPDPTVKCPTLVLWGEEDIALSKACNRTLPVYVLNLDLRYLPGISHWTQMHAADEVNAALLEFIGY
jgi:pimeloyl-ACP methyl ester carboxylesterase